MGEPNRRACSRRVRAQPQNAVPRSLSLQSRSCRRGCVPWERAAPGCAGEQKDQYPFAAAYSRPLSAQAVPAGCAGQSLDANTATVLHPVMAAQAQQDSGAEPASDTKLTGGGSRLSGPRLRVGNRLAQLWVHYSRSQPTQTGPIVRFAEVYERILGRMADVNLCVTEAMRKWLADNWQIQATVLHDRPPRFVFHQ